MRASLTDVPIVTRRFGSLSATSYSLLRLFRWLSVSSSLMSAADNFGRSSLIFSLAILPLKANGTW